MAQAYVGTNVVRHYREQAQIQRNTQQEDQRVEDDVFFRFEDLPPCEMSSFEFSQLSSTEPVGPCILYDVVPSPSLSMSTSNSTSVIQLVNVSPSSCANHRDGAYTAVQRMNGNSESDDTEGIRIGFYQDHIVQFSLLTVIAGNPNAMTSGQYERQHAHLLKMLVEHSQAPYIIGTCSSEAAAIEKNVALQTQSLLMSQVGPPSFYAPEVSNPYVFGFHIDSDTYPLPFVQELLLLENSSRESVDEFVAEVEDETNANEDKIIDTVNQTGRIPIKVVYRNQSDFFFSTCQSAIDKLHENKNMDVETFLYDPTADHDQDGVVNALDEDFLMDLADQVCPPEQSATDNIGESGGSVQQPALFLCTLTEQDIFFKRWLETGCRPYSVWVTAATWNWADENPEKRPYLLGGGQWHQKFDYSDRYFTSGQALLDYNNNEFGYRGTYDQVVSYAIPLLFAQHLEETYRVTDMPNPLEDFQDEQGRERLRRSMMVLNVDTIFGPVAFNNLQRNVGRDAAGTQWLQTSSSGQSGPRATVNRLVSPFLQAESSTQIPAASAENCTAGQFVNMLTWRENGTLLAGGCDVCPVDSFTLQPSQVTQCSICPGGSITNGETGSDQCFVYNENLLNGGIIGFGYTATCISWLLAIGFLGWIYKYRKDPVVKVSQIEFLVLICIGTMVSSSAVIALSIQAGFDEDTSAASAGCMAAPFLYTIGWILQFSSLSAKTYRLYQTIASAKQMKRISVTALHMIPFVITCVMIDVIIVLIWTVRSPLMYERTENSRSIDDESGIVTIETVGRCVSSDDNFWAYAGPLMAFHLLLVVITNLLLCRVREIADRYQEQRYIAIPSMLMLEVLVIGIPVLVSVNDSTAATFIVMVAIVALNDIAVLLCIFVPKVLYQRKGLEEGVHVNESILRRTHRRASAREDSKHSILDMTAGSVNGVKGSYASHTSPTESLGNSASQSGRQLERVFSNQPSDNLGGNRRTLLSECMEENGTIVEETDKDLEEYKSESGCSESSANEGLSPAFECRREGNFKRMTPVGIAPAEGISSISTFLGDTDISTQSECEKLEEKKARIKHLTEEFLEKRRRLKICCQKVSSEDTT